MSRSAHSIAVIGGGIAGLVAGTCLARTGRRVHLFESRPVLGGCCSTTSVSGYTFNNGALYLALPAILDEVFRALGLDRERLVPLARIIAPQSTYLPDGTVVTVGSDMELHVTTPGGRTYPIDVSHLVARWSPIMATFVADLAARPYSLLRTLSHTWRYLPRLRGTVASELARQVPDRAARSALAGLLLYSGLPPERTPVFQMVGLACLFADGFYLPAGGMGQITAALATALAASGAEIHVGRTVTRILAADRRASALEVDGRDRLEFDAVISAVSGMHTARLLQDAAPPALLRRAGRTPLSHQAVCVQLGLRNRLRAPSHSMSVLPWAEEMAGFFNQDGPELRYLHYTVPTLTLPGLAPAGGSVIEMFPPIPQGLPASGWDDARIDSTAERAIAALRRRHELDVAVMRTIGPRQFQDDLGLYAGAAYGLSPAADMRALFPAVTSVPGLYQAGQTSHPGYGVAPAAASGLIAARLLLDQRA